MPTSDPNVRLQRVTIDVTVAREYLDEREGRHPQAEELFELAGLGSIEIVTAPQGYRLDVCGDLAEQLTEMFEREGIAEAPQLAYPSKVTFPGENLFPGAYVAGFGEAWDSVLASWRSHEGKKPESNDRWHLETHINAGRDVFITNDRGLLAMSKRLREEYRIEVVAMKLEDYLETHRADEHS